MAKTILFQGDSITDCGRSRENDIQLGAGYPTYVKNALGTDAPNEYAFINRGISGNRIVDLYARIKIDFTNLQPDYASIYIGVNDTLHESYHNNGVDTKKFEMVYCMMLDEIYEACHNIKLMLIAPFVLEGPITVNVPEDPNRLEFFRADVKEKALAVQRIAEKYSLPVIQLQPLFDEALKKAPERYWSEDGVHPTVYGHQLITRAWLDVFNKIK